MPDLFEGLSIVIRTFNSSATLADLLSKLILTPNDELIIIDSGSTDRTLQIASSFRAKIFKNPKPFHYSSSLNYGFSFAKKEWVLVISSHCVPTDFFFLERIRVFLQKISPSCAVAYGYVGITPPKHLSSQTVGNLINFKAGLFEPGGNPLAVYRKSLWTMHSFDENIDTAEDLEWFLWAVHRGYTAQFIPGAMCVSTNKGKLFHMFKKGNRDTRMRAKLLGLPAPSFFILVKNLLVSFLYFFWLFICFRISFQTLIRHLFHRLGAFWGDCFNIFRSF